MAVSRRDVVVTVRFTEDEADVLRLAADEAGRSVSAFVRDATLRYLGPRGRASVSSTTGTVAFAPTTTGTGFPVHAVGREGQPVGGNLKPSNG